MTRMFEMPNPSVGWWTRSVEMSQCPPCLCNAGIGGSSLVLKQRVEHWMDMMATNLTGTFHCLRAMAPPLLAQGDGSIVIVGSHAGFHGSVGQAAYAASKAGLIGLMKTA